MVDQHPSTVADRLAQLDRQIGQARFDYGNSSWSSGSWHRDNISKLEAKRRAVASEAASYEATLNVILASADSGPISPEDGDRATALIEALRGFGINPVGSVAAK